MDEEHSDLNLSPRPEKIIKKKVVKIDDFDKLYAYFQNVSTEANKGNETGLESESNQATPIPKSFIKPRKILEINSNKDLQIFNEAASINKKIRRSLEPRSSQPKFKETEPIKRKARRSYEPSSTRMPFEGIESIKNIPRRSLQPSNNLIQLEETIFPTRNDVFRSSLTSSRATPKSPFKVKNISHINQPFVPLAFDLGSPLIQSVPQRRLFQMIAKEDISIPIEVSRYVSPKKASQTSFSEKVSSDWKQEHLTIDPIEYLSDSDREVEMENYTEEGIGTVTFHSLFDSSRNSEALDLEIMKYFDEVQRTPSNNSVISDVRLSNQPTLVRKSPNNLQDDRILDEVSTLSSPGRNHIDAEIGAAKSALVVESSPVLGENSMVTSKVAFSAVSESVFMPASAVDFLQNDNQTLLEEPFISRIPEEISEVDVDSPVVEAATFQRDIEVSHVETEKISEVNLDNFEADPVLPVKDRAILQDNNTIVPEERPISVTLPSVAVEDNLHPGDLDLHQSRIDGSVSSPIPTNELAHISPTPQANVSPILSTSDLSLSPDYPLAEEEEEEEIIPLADSPEPSIEEEPLERDSEAGEEELDFGTGPASFELTPSPHASSFITTHDKQSLSSLAPSPLPEDGDLSPTNEFHPLGTETSVHLNTTPVVISTLPEGVLTPVQSSSLLIDQNNNQPTVDPFDISPVLIDNGLSLIRDSPNLTLINQNSTMILSPNSPKAAGAADLSPVQETSLLLREFEDVLVPILDDSAAMLPPINLHSPGTPNATLEVDNNIFEQLIQRTSKVSSSSDSLLIPSKSHTQSKQTASTLYESSWTESPQEPVRLKSFTELLGFDPTTKARPNYFDANVSTIKPVTDQKGPKVLNLNKVNPNYGSKTLMRQSVGWGKNGLFDTTHELWKPQYRANSAKVPKLRNADDELIPNIPTDFILQVAREVLGEETVVTKECLPFLHHLSHRFFKNTAANLKRYAQHRADSEFEAKSLTGLDGTLLLKRQKLVTSQTNLIQLLQTNFDKGLMDQALLPDLDLEDLELKSKFEKSTHFKNMQLTATKPKN